MKIPSYKFLPLMYQLAARMGTKMMGGLGFHEVLNNVSKRENQTTIAFLLYYCILLFHSRKWQHKKVSVSHSIQSLNRLQLFATPWIATHPASLSITNPRSLLKLMSIESVIPSSHLILCRPLLLLPPIPPSIRVFSNDKTLHMRWPKYWSFSFSISPSNEHPGLISFRMD